MSASKLSRVYLVGVFSGAELLECNQVARLPTIRWSWTKGNLTLFQNKVI